MKKDITIYYDYDWKFYATLEDLEEPFEERQAEDIEAYGMPTYKSVKEWADSMVYDGWFEEITATLSDRNTVYPFYYVEDGIGVKTIMDMYMAWQDMPYTDRMCNVPTFADFLNIPQEDRNAVMFYGFEKDE